MDGTFDYTFKREFELGNIEMAPENEIQKFNSEIKDWIPRLEPMEVKRLNAFQDRIGSHWLNVIPCKT